MSFIKILVKLLFFLLLFIIIPLGVTALITWYFLYFRQGINPLTNTYAPNEVISFIGGLLAYYGAVILGYVAVVQNSKSIKQNHELIKQNEKLFFLDKDSYIQFLSQVRIKKYKYSENFYLNSHSNEQMNFYVANEDSAFLYNKRNKSFSLFINYKVVGPFVKDLKLTALSINDCNIDYFIDPNIKTDVVSNIIEGESNYFCEIFLIGNNVDKMLKNKLKSGALILTLEFEITNILKITTYERTDINFESFPYKEFPAKYNDELFGNFDNICYNYEKNIGVK